MIHFLKNRLARREAEADAKRGIDSTELRLREEFGKKPEWDPVDNPAHALVAETLGERAELEELRSDRRRLEDELARHPSRKALLLFLVLTGAIEAFGGILIMKSLGRENPERTFLGIALALGTLGFTAFVSKTTAEVARASEGKPRRTLASLILLGLYTLFALAVAVTRIELPEGEEGIDLLSYAEALLMVATTVLPALTAEWIFRTREPAVRAARALKNTNARIRRLEAARADAVKFIQDLARKRECYEDATERRGAAFRIAHRLASADSAKTNDTNETRAETTERA
jgi:hypothetical protein